MTNPKRIQAAAERVSAATPRKVGKVNGVDDVLRALRLVPGRYKMAFTKGGTKVFWDQVALRYLTHRYAFSKLKKLGYEAVDRLMPPREMRLGDVRILIGADQGFLGFSEEMAIRGSVTAATQDFMEYDNYEEWKKAAKEHWPDARHNKKGLPGWVHGYGEEDDEEFTVGPDMQSDIVAVWMTADESGWVMRVDADEEN